MGDPLDIIVVGAGRAASTSIASYLGQHPDIVLSEPKEAHFFDIYYDEGIHAIPPMYFGHRTTETLAVEATPDYLTLPWVPDRIAASLPQVKLVATLRNPVDRAWSQWWLLYTRGIEDLPFEDAIAANLARLESGEPLDELKWAEHVAIRSQGIGQVYRLYLDHGYYAQNLARYFEHFDRDAMFVIFTDELKEEPEKTVRSLYRFVGARSVYHMSHKALTDSGKFASIQNLDFIRGRIRQMSFRRKSGGSK